MTKSFRSFIFTALTALLFSCQSSLPEDVDLAYQDLPAQVDFNFHIKPILADRCYKCHGPDDDAREAELRLDLEKEAFAKLKGSGRRAFVKGKIGKSQAWHRIRSDDPDIQMPPPEANLSLSAKEKALIAKWIRQGAQWKEHWAFIPPEKPQIPEGIPPDWTVNNPIDYFILAKFQEQGLSPSPPADKERLIRRATMDLTGLPPAISEIADFMADDSPQAYEKLIDRLLDTEAYAERLAMEWLDVARYADSQGLHTDMTRYSWPWRDWTIRAFKQNMAYDDFIAWQLAGDLTPNATQEQKLATAFLRNHPVSAEGGAISEEFRQQYVQDRTNTMATAFLGLTLECAACHDHKFDPISQKEYYQTTAFFNNLKEIGMVAEGGGASGPVLLLPEPETAQKLARLEKEIEQVQQQIQLTRSEVIITEKFIQSIQKGGIEPPPADAQYPFETIETAKKKTRGGSIHRILNNHEIDKMVDANPLSPASGEPQLVKGKVGNALRLETEFDLVFLKNAGTFELNEAFSAGAWIYTEKTGENQSIMGNSGELGNAWRGWDLFIDTLNRPSIRLTSYWPHNYIQITANQPVSKNEWRHILFTYDGSAKAGGLNLYVDGKKADSFIEHDNLYRSIVHNWRKREDWMQKPVMVGRSGRFYTGDNGVFLGSIDQVKLFHLQLSPIEVAAMYSEDTNSSLDPSAFTSDLYVDHYLYRKHPGFQAQTQKLGDLLAQKLETIKDVPEIMVMEDMPKPRKTFVLNRGQYNSPTEEVEPGTPKKVMAFKSDLPKNRLGLARWLVDPNNPLTARVAVNRYWQMIFGRGIVETPHDFGVQGALPTHPDLLDWLAVYFVESGWDVKALLKLMLRSATYRQTSAASPEHLEKDADNLFLARGPSYRLAAEMIRDNALAASGLLSRKVGGASVKPYQPEGLWVEKTGPHLAYKHDSGDSLYRRSMYTFVRRTTPHPAMIAFDAPNRSVCVVKRENTNTPLQALVLLNDPQFVEAARVLAERMQKEGGKTLENQTRYGFRLLCGRLPNPKEAKLIKKQYQAALDKYQENPQAAEALLQVGEYPADSKLDKIQTAALTMVANTMMNFDEAYMKR